MFSRRYLFVFSLLAMGCDPEEPGSARIKTEAKCLQLIADGQFVDGAWLARERGLHIVALALLARLEAESDYDAGCLLCVALCELTGYDVPYGYGVPEEDHHIWARERLKYWRAWLSSSEGVAFLEGAKSSGRT